MAFLDGIVATNPPDSEDIRLGASRIRGLADAVIDSFGAAHSLSDGLHDYATDPPPGAGASGSGGGGVGHAARAYLSSNQSHASSGTAQRVDFDSEDFDLDGEFDSTTNYRFTPTVAGLYLVTASVAFAHNVTGYRSIFVLKNGTYVWGNAVQAVTVTSIETVVTVSAILDMNGSTDYIRIYANQDSGGALNMIGSGSQYKTHVSIAKLPN